MTSESEFWGRVKLGTPFECWEWQGATTSSGYGSLHWRGKTVVAHRLAYSLQHGGINVSTKFRVAGWAASHDKFVLHKCDNRRCCNPKHLFLGSMHDNLLDAYSKGRKQQPKSEHANAKLSPQDVLDIRKRYVRGVTRQVDIASEYGVSQRVISLIVRNETYKDLLP